MIHKVSDAKEMSVLIATAAKVKGILTCNGNGTARIDGTMDGKIDTRGHLLVGDGAVITANVSASTITCRGRITGDITAQENVRLQSSAVVNGSVITPFLLVDEGGEFHGKLTMLRNDGDCGQSN